MVPLPLATLLAGAGLGLLRVFNCSNLKLLGLGAVGLVAAAFGFVISASFFEGLPLSSSSQSSDSPTNSALSEDLFAFAGFDVSVRGLFVVADDEDFEPAIIPKCYKATLTASWPCSLCAKP